ncbi:MAG: sulfotransferase [Pseudomonadota bacterium]
MSTSNADKPIFIVGAARSGTTLLQFMLRSHPHVSLPTAESHFFIPFYAARDEYGDLTERDNLRRLISDIYEKKQLFFKADFHGMTFDVEAVTDMLHREQCSNVPDIISRIFQENAKGEGKVRWGDKTPYYVLHMDTLLAMFPGAQFVHLIRDGRDCALSMLERKHDLKIFNTYHAAYTWNKYVVSGRAFGERHPDRYFEVRYEDILDNPQDSIQALCEFLEIEFSQDVIEFRKAKEGLKTPLLRQPLQRSNQNKWKSKMSEKQIEIFENMAGETLEACGYDLASSSPSISAINRLYYELEIKWNHYRDR